MCGIAGRVELTGREVRHADLTKLADAIAHRGPDDAGTFVSKDRSVGLANRRLAIIDLSPKGHQPMSYKGRYTITFNGEIYNFQDERAKLQKLGYRFNSKTDTEVIMALYDKYGKGCLKYLRGMFSFALYDEKEKTLFVAVGRLGKKPFKYFWNGRTFIFASELKAILTQKEVRPLCDWEAVHNFLTYGYVFSPQTGFKDIYKLGPGCYLFLDIKKKRLEKVRYYKPDFSRKLYLTEEEWIERILAELSEATRLRMISDVPIGAFLSGGVDSSMVVASMARLSSAPIKTFTIGFKEVTMDETPYANRISELYGTDHRELTVEPASIEILPWLVKHFEEPFADASSLITYLVSKIAREKVTVILNGDGGDENFGGYDRYCRLKRDAFLENFRVVRPLVSPFTHFLAEKTKSSFIRRADKFLKKMKGTLAERYVSYNSYFLNEDKDRLYTDYLKEKVGETNSYEIMMGLFEEAAAPDPRDRALYADLVMYMPEDLLVKVDIASMAASLEGRSPFLDHKLVDMACQIPFDLKVEGRCNLKYILKKAAERLVPKENLYRPKMGFSIPLKQWFTGKINKYAESVLLSKKALGRGIFEERVVRSMLKTHGEKEDFGAKLWSLLTLELWFRSYFD